MEQRKVTRKSIRYGVIEELDNELCISVNGPHPQLLKCVLTSHEIQLYVEESQAIPTPDTTRLSSERVSKFRIRIAKTNETLYKGGTHGGWSYLDSISYSSNADLCHVYYKLEN